MLIEIATSVFTYINLSTTNVVMVSRVLVEVVPLVNTFGDRRLKNIPLLEIVLVQKMAPIELGALMCPELPFAPELESSNFNIMK